MSVNLNNIQAFKLKGRFYTLTVLKFLQTDPQVFSQQLQETVSQAPKLFEKAPLVLDFSEVGNQTFDLRSIYQMICEHGIIPVAIQGADPFHDTIAQSLGMAVLNASSAQDKSIQLETESSEAASPETAAAKLITAPVRSGQQVVAKNSDLIITAPVSHGAELLADGNIHVYGPLRGRALAGISGNKEARIFCQALSAELLSIAGYYRLSDAIETFDRPCQIFLKDDQIQIQAL